MCRRSIGPPVDIEHRADIALYGQRQRLGRQRRIEPDEDIVAVGQRGAGGRADDHTGGNLACGDTVAGH